MRSRAFFRPARIATALAVVAAIALTGCATTPAPTTDDAPAASLDLDDVSTSRTTLRLPDALKSRVDEAAAADGVSVNTWLVRAVSAALQPKQRKSAQRTLRTGDNFAGWAR